MKSRYRYESGLLKGRLGWSAFGAVLVLALLAGPAVAAVPTPSSQPVSEAPDALILPGTGRDRHMVVVEKATQKLYIYEYDRGRYYLRRVYDCTTGENEGDKTVEGDKKTPEGYYQFVKKSLEHELAPIYGVLAFPMDYPNFWDRRLGRNGSGIWLHGLDRPRVAQDTNGCVALENVDLIELEELVRLYETPIVIYDRVRYAPVADLDRQAARIRNFVESWRRAWEKQDFEAYRSKYARDFISDDGKDYQAWMDHKRRLNRKYDRILVRLDDLRIFRHKGAVVVLFEQYYQGGQFKSDGVKRLYLEERDGRYKIAAEEWEPFPVIAPTPMLSAEVRNRVLAEGRMPIRVASVESSENRTSRSEGAAKPAGEPKSEPEAPAAPQKPSSPEPLSPDEEERVRRVVEEWLTAWRDMDIDRYVDHYHPDFRYKGMDLEGYKSYKKDLKKRYDTVEIEVEQMNVQVEGDEALVTFVQDYRSDKYHDFGLKTLIMSKKDQSWRIREESWKDMSAGAKP